MKFKILILFVFFSAFATICKAQEGMSEGLIEGVFLVLIMIVALILNCLLLFILPKISWRIVVLIGNIWIALSSAIIITVLIFTFIDNSKHWSTKPGIEAYIFLLLHIVMLMFGLYRLREKLNQN